MAPDPGPLLAHLDAFVGFVRRRTHDPDLAAEVVQEALRKALAHPDDLRDAERLLPWFWRILRNTLADALVRRGREAPLPEELAALPEEESRAICACIAQALDRLPQRQREAVQRIDLAGQDPDAVATDLALSAGNLKVIRHRARQALREHLQTICRTCADHGCLDCHCRPK